MPYDVQHALDHAEVAGWVLGVLGPDDARDFEAHLSGCDQCQAAVAEFEPVAQGLSRAAPAVEPPADLAAKTLAAVQHAILAARPTQLTPEKAKGGKASRWWHLHWSNPLLPVATALAAAAVTAAAFVAVQTLAFAAPAVAATFSLQAQHGHAGTGTATVRQHNGGWEIQLTVDHLAALPSGQFYECWYAGPDNRPGHPDLITAGTFVVNHSGNGTFTMWSAANPAQFKTMQIAAEQPGDASQRGAVLLTGTARA
jgi:anti-sigma-K factor RskA